MKLLITGAAGFIGYALADKLCRRGDDVVGIDNLNQYYDVELKQSRLNQLETYDNFQFDSAYKNWYCAMCNYIRYPTCTYGSSGKYIPSYSMRFLLDLNKGQYSQFRHGESTHETTLRKCPNNTILDTSRGMCRTLVCPIGHTMNDEGECETDELPIYDPVVAVPNSNKKCPSFAILDMSDRKSVV
jgi:hypothetical protein